jgi:hypothetical protein
LTRTDRHCAALALAWVHVVKNLTSTIAAGVIALTAVVLLLREY